jgi:hypothetical protein
MSSFLSPEPFVQNVAAAVLHGSIEQECFLVTYSPQEKTLGAVGSFVVPLWSISGLLFVQGSLCLPPAFF